MKFYSSETMRQHAQDLTNEIKVKRIDERLRYFIINMDKKKSVFPMHDLASKIAKEWPAVGVLDQHDLAQEFYCSLVRAFNRVKWDVINDADNPKAALWAYLKKSIKLDVRQAINTFKDGMRIPHYKLWEAKKDDGVLMENFFTISMPNTWFWEKDEELGILDDARMTRWETEVLYEGLQDIMRANLTTIERQVLEACFGIDEPHEKPKSQQTIANYFNKTLSWVQTTKFRAIKKLKNEDVKNYLSNYTEI